jgi:hypothetical protein
MAFLHAHSIPLQPSDISEGCEPARPPRLAGHYVLYREGACEWIEFNGRFWMTAQGILLLPYRSQDVFWYGRLHAGEGSDQVGPMTL